MAEVHADTTEPAGTAQLHQRLHMLMQGAGFAVGGPKSTVSAFHGLPVALSIVFS